MKLIVLPLLLIAQMTWAAKKSDAVTYFSCKVKEVTRTRKTPVDITVKFAIKGYDQMNEKGELVPYPGGNEEMGYISVTPEQIGSGKDKYYPTMMNLNGQGGDLRLEGNNLRLFGDGDGYQFTDLVIWEPDAEDGNKLEGYVHDYGSTYGGAETFKQFIKCKRSEKQL